MFEDVTAMYQAIGMKGTFFLVVSVYLIPKILTTGITAYSMYKHAQSNKKLGGDVAEAFPKFIRQFKENTYINIHDSLILYDEFSEAHIYKKVKFVTNIINRNNLKSRKHEIKENIETVFISLTDDSIGKLSRYRSLIGDMGSIVKKSIDWDELFCETYEIIFNEDFTKEQKINDFELKMKKFVTKIREVLRERGEENKRIM